MGMGVPFFGFGKLKKVVASPKRLGKDIVILLRRTFRTLFATAVILLPQAGPGRKVVRGRSSCAHGNAPGSVIWKK
jgi:hypothetical protein